VSDDLLDALLRAALADGALAEDTLPHFAEALRARAARILAERVQPLAERAAAFEKESAWRAGLLVGLEQEKQAWHLENTRLKDERDLRIDEVQRLKAERQALIEESARSSQQNEQLKKEREALIEENTRRIEQNEQLKKEREALIVEREALVEDRDRLRRERAALVAEMDSLRAEKRMTSEAHDQLLAHHQATLARLTEALASVPADLPWRYKRVRARIEDLVEVLRKQS